MTLLEWAPFHCYFSATLVELKFHISYYYQLIPQFYSGSLESLEKFSTLYETHSLSFQLKSLLPEHYGHRQQERTTLKFNRKKNGQLSWSSADKISATLQKNSSSNALQNLSERI
jgi:hypothetical protein